MAVDHNLELITLKEAARLLRVSEATVRRWLKQGRLPAYHVGPRAVRIRRADVDAVISPLNNAGQPSNGVDIGSLQGRDRIGPPRSEALEQTLQALATTRVLGEEIRQRLAGAPFAESWPIIREAREDATHQWQ